MPLSPLYRISNYICSTDLKIQHILHLFNIFCIFAFCYRYVLFGNNYVIMSLSLLMMLYRPVIASQLLLVDEVIRAGRNMRKPT